MYIYGIIRHYDIFERERDIYIYIFNTTYNYTYIVDDLVVCDLQRTPCEPVSRSPGGRFLIAFRAVDRS